MPLISDLSVSPYFDDYSESKKFYKVLFRPGLSVQTRELNQLQTLLQSQIERMGDNIFESGTIVSGVNFNYDGAFSYVKLKDIDAIGLQATPSNYVGLYATSSYGLKAYIKNYREGFEATDPDLKTIYLDYITAGINGEGEFAPGDLLRVADRYNSIYSVSISNPGSTYSNSDSVVFTSAVSVNTVAGVGFQVGELVTQVNPSTRAVILEVNNDIYTDRTVLRLKPYDLDLGNTSLLTSPWDMSNNITLTGSTSGTTATVIDVVGYNAEGRVVTDGAGRVVDIIITNGGRDYRLLPHATVKPVVTPTAIQSGLDITARNYLADVYVATTANAVGSGYAMSVTDGVIYQKGYFVKVDAQTIIVDPYSPTPNNLSVIFRTDESLITPEIDPTLYDNALGEPNETAPGAHRLQLTANLSVVNTDIVESSPDFMILTSFSEGQAWRKNQYTKYNAINDEMARRHYDDTGDYALDKFHATTRSPVAANTGGTVSLIVEPGRAYISGYRVEVNRNYSTELQKGTDTAIANSQYVSLSYDNYVRVKEVGGVFNFHTGDVVSFFDKEKKFISNSQLIWASNTAADGNLIATAQMRSMVLESGQPGTAGAIYRMYVYNMQTVAGRNFAHAKNIHYQGSTANGVADIVLDYLPTIASNGARLQGNNAALVFSPFCGSIKQISNVTYTYRSVNTTMSIANTGVGAISLVSTPHEKFPYTGSAALNNVQMQELYVCPTSNTFVGSVGLTGTVTVSTTSANLIGSGTSFVSELQAGDYVVVSNTVAEDCRQVVLVVNSTYAILDANCDVNMGPGATVYRYFPPYVPVPFGSRSYLAANLNANGAILTLDFGGRFKGTSPGTVSIGYNAVKSSVTPGSKTASRLVYVKINTATHSAGAYGPWCLGIPDVVRLRGVWEVGQNDVVPSSNNWTGSFYIDSNQTVGQVGQAWLYRYPGQKLNTTSKYLLIGLDCATISVRGFYSTESYTTALLPNILANDVKTTDQLTGLFSTWEIPEFTDRGKYFDMMQYLDFRPVSKTTANIANVTVNPVVNSSIDTSINWKFPLPGSTLTADIEYYLPRIDSVVIDKTGVIEDIKGSPATDPTAPQTPKQSMLIDQFYIPAYPNIPANPSATLINAISTFMASGSLNTQRIKRSMIKSVMTQAAAFDSQPKGYTMHNIGELERRIQNLEYYVSLNSLETLVTQQAIPSSISQNVNRFKYGFYVDDYSTKNFVDLLNPEWAATVYTDRVRCYPKSEVINLPHYNVGFPGYGEFTMVTQPLASYPPPPPPPPPTIEPPPVVNTTPNTTPNTQPQPCELVAHIPTVWTTIGRTLVPGTNGSDTINVTMSDASVSNCTLYAIGEPLYTIKQGGVVVATSATAVSLTANDIAMLEGRPFMMTDARFSSNVSDYLLHRPLWKAADGSIGGGAKIVFAHNASRGKEYTIEVTSGQAGFGTDLGDGRTIDFWKYMLDYPVNGDTYFDCANTGTPPVPVVNVAANTQSNTVEYHDVVTEEDDDCHEPPVIHTEVDRNCECETGREGDEHRVRFRQNGCRPGHTYAFFLENENSVGDCRQKGKRRGEALQADRYGHLDFDFHYAERARGDDNNCIMENYEDCAHRIDPEGTTGLKRCTIVNITNRNEKPKHGYIKVNGGRNRNRGDRD